MTTYDRIDEERADQANDAAHAHNEAMELLNTAHDVAVKLAHLMDMAACASEASTPEQCLGYVADARAQARRIAEMVGDWA